MKFCNNVELIGVNGCDCYTDLYGIHLDTVP
jgi:hypothetical protein